MLVTMIMMTHDEQPGHHGIFSDIDIPLSSHPL
jgi:hypothetical protein